MSYQHQSSSSQSARGGRDPRPQGAAQISPELADYVDAYAQQGPAALAAALGSFPEKERAECWAYVQNRYGNAFVSQATEDRSMGTPTADPAIVSQLFASARKDARAAGAWLRHTYPEPFWMVYATALYEYGIGKGNLHQLKAEALIHRLMGRDGPADALEKMYYDDLMARTAPKGATTKDWKDDDGGLAGFGPAEPTAEAAPVVEAAPAQAQAQTKSMEPAEQAALEAELAHIKTLVKTLNPQDPAAYQQVSAAAQQLQRWRAVFPRSQDDASFTVFTGFNPHLALLQAERFSETWIGRYHQSGS